MKNKENACTLPRSPALLSRGVLLVVLLAGAGSMAAAREPIEELPLTTIGDVAGAAAAADEAQLGESGGEPVEDAPVEGEPGPGEAVELPPDDLEVPEGDDPGAAEDLDGPAADSD